MTKKYQIFFILEINKFKILKLHIIQIIWLTILKSTIKSKKNKTKRVSHQFMAQVNHKETNMHSFLHSSKAQFLQVNNHWRIYLYILYNKRKVHGNFYCAHAWEFDTWHFPRFFGLFVPPFFCPVFLLPLPRVSFLIGGF